LPVYRRILQRFDDWLCVNKVIISSFGELDSAMECYYEWVHSAGQPTSWAKQLKAAVVLRCPSAKDRLPASSAAVRGYFRAHPSTVYDPVAPHLALALSMFFWLDGDLDVSLAVLLAFTCCLRIGATCRLRWEHLVLANDVRVGSVVTSGSTLTVPLAKNGKDLVFPINQPLVVALLHRWRGVTRMGRVFPRLTAARLRRKFTAGLRHFRITSLHFHGLRHGWAAWMHLHFGLSPGAIQELANWKALTTARLYIFRARRKLVESLLPVGADEESVIRFVRLDHWSIFGLEPGGPRFQGLV
jgi:integrase